MIAILGSNISEINSLINSLEKKIAFVKLRMIMQMASHCSG